KKPFTDLSCGDALLLDLWDLLRQIRRPLPFRNHEIAATSLQRFEHRLGFAAQFLFEERNAVAFGFAEKKAERPARCRRLRRSAFASTSTRTRGFHWGRV